MYETEFDRFAEEYRTIHAQNIRLSGESPEFFTAYKITDVAREMSAACTVPNPRILDFGAGVGNSVPFFQRWLTPSVLVCLDVSRKSLAIGQERFRELADFIAFDGRTLPFADNSFDLIFTACVFHHIPHEHHGRILEELHRTLAPTGLLVIFEHNPFNPLTVQAVKTCPFDENARLIAPGKLRRAIATAGFQRPRIRYRIFFPGWLRALRPLERAMTWLPVGAQYYVRAEK